MSSPTHLSYLICRKANPSTSRSSHTNSLHTERACLGCTSSVRCLGLERMSRCLMASAPGTDGHVQWVLPSTLLSSGYLGNRSFHSTNASSGGVPGPEIASLFLVSLIWMSSPAWSIKQVLSSLDMLDSGSNALDFHKCKVCALRSLQDKREGTAASTRQSGPGRRESVEMEVRRVLWGPLPWGASAPGRRTSRGRTW